MKAVIRAAGSVASRVRVGAHELVFDQPRTVPGGDDRGPSPLDVMVLSVAACTHYYAAAFLHARGLPTDDLAVEVESEKDRAPVSRIGRLSLKVRLPPGLSDQQRTALENAIRSCPAYGTLLHPPAIELSLSVGGTAAA